MVYDPNSTWSAKAAERTQAPVYFLRLDGMTDRDYSTAPVRNATRTKKVLLDMPRGLVVSLDPIQGVRPVASVQVPLLDVGGEVSALIATEAPDALLPSLINRKAWIYGGYRDIDESDYAPIFGGRISGVSLDKPGKYLLTISDPSRALDGEIMGGATSEKPTTIQGNPVNIYWAILTGTFSTTHATFPLDEVSTDSSTTSAPTGLGIPTSEIDEDMLAEQRDAWYPDALVKVTFRSPVTAKYHLQREFFRVFQGWPVITQDGKFGLRFFVPPIPSAAAEELTPDEIIGLPKWRRRFEDHLNRFRYYGNYDADADSYDAILYDEDPTTDTDDRTATGETITYEVLSKWLRNDVANQWGETGEDTAADLASRMRLRYLKTPAEIELQVAFSESHLEEGDVVAVTHPLLPDLLTGEVGVTARLMVIVSRAPDFEKGLIRLRLLDTGFRRYGTVAENSTPDYTSATAKQQSEFVFLSNSSGEMSDGSPGYRMA